jgi:hypothetical protein
VEAVDHITARDVHDHGSCLKEAACVGS